MEVKGIIQQYLYDNGYDGLQHESDCGCELSDLIPCDEDCSRCTPGYKIAANDGSEFDWYIVPKVEDGDERLPVAWPETKK